MSNDNPLTLPTPSFSLVGTTLVPNVFPSVEPTDYRLAIVGEAPGADEEAQGVPFVGASGKFLDSLLASAGVLRQQCFVGNVCQHRPPGNDIAKWGFGHDLVVAGWTQLQVDLQTFQPNCILALGNTPLHFLYNRSNISSWRGSILQSLYGKVVPSLHPAAVLRDYKLWVFLRHDIGRALQEARSSELSLPQRTLNLNLTADEICHHLDNWPPGRILSFDIEGGLDAFPCCSVADAPNNGFIIAWSKYDDFAQGRIAVSLSRCLYRTDVPKVLQNSLYDRFVLAYQYHMLIRGVVDDTMLKFWELYPEASGKKDDQDIGGRTSKGLGKNLGVIASVFTREPFYKHEIKSDDRDTFYRYCIKDSCVTLESSLAMDGALSPPASRHYRFNVSLLSPLLYMELRGFNYDKVTAALELAQCRAALAETRTRLELRVLPQQWTKTEFSNSICGKGGSISDARLAKILYNQMGFPVQKQGRGPTARITADADALLKIKKKHPNDTFLNDVLLHRKLESIRETLEVSTDPDGRVRCGYNLVGTETGRLTCYTSPTGSGANLQTITKKLRKLYRADEGFWLFQCDLSGADGWTVAAYCRAHGDPTMWDDYHVGLKPARLIALMYAGIDISRYSRNELKELSLQVDDDSWEYFACKRVQHATNYGVTEKTGADQVMKDSYKLTGNAIYIEPKTFAELQRLYFVRYPGLYQWHAWAKREVMNGHNLMSASGHTRLFFGRRKTWNPRLRQHEADHDTWKEFLADEPQENTTYVTNLAVYRLWHDTENRNGSSLTIQPLHQVHDALIGQFPKTSTDWAITRIRSYFSNPLTIAGQQLTIPFDGAYGPSWGELGPKYGGGKI